MKATPSEPKSRASLGSKSTWFALAVFLGALLWIKFSPKASETWVIQIPIGQEQRERVLENLVTESSGVLETAWKLRDGCARVPSYPAVMVSQSDLLFLATEDRLEVYGFLKGGWFPEALTLAERVGPGLALLSWNEDSLILASGGGSSSLFQISWASRSVEPLPSFPQAIGRGAALAEWNRELYLTPGNLSDEFWVLRELTGTWEQLGRMGGESSMDLTFGHNSGFLATLGDAIYAWPNHHIHRFDALRQDWQHGPEVGQELHYGNWVAMNFLPVYDGGGVATLAGVGSIYAIGGSFSRSLNEIESVSRQLHLLRPRLPYPSIGEGDRLTLAEIDGVPQLVVYAIEPENKLCFLPISALERISVESDKADTNSAWHRFHTAGGGNGVRNWTTRIWRGPPKPMDLSPRGSGSLGVMGAMGDELFSMRRAFTRRIDAGQGLFSYYPGFNLGQEIGLGACGLYDGAGHMYFMPGRSSVFLRRALLPGKISLRAPERRLPPDETEMELLPDTPGVVGRAASMASIAGSIYALRGSATHEFWCYEPEQGTWELMPSLPEEALPVGREGGGLIAGEDCLFAVSGNQVWRFGLVDESWTRFATLGFGLHWDGGMLAADGEGQLYVIKGGHSTRLGRLDLETGVFEELAPRLPEAVAAEGNRMAVIGIEGQRRLYLHRGNNSNEILWIPLSDLRAR